VLAGEDWLSYAVYVSQPKAVAALIAKAANGVGPGHTVIIQHCDESRSVPTCGGRT